MHLTSSSLLAHLPGLGPLSHTHLTDTPPHLLCARCYAGHQGTGSQGAQSVTGEETVIEQIIPRTGHNYRGMCRLVLSQCQTTVSLDGVATVGFFQLSSSPLPKCSSWVFFQAPVMRPGLCVDSKESPKPQLGLSGGSGGDLAVHGLQAVVGTAWITQPWIMTQRR